MARELRTREKGLQKPTGHRPPLIVVDHTNIYYRVCEGCERPLPDPNPNTPSPLCTYCHSTNALNPPSPASKLIFRFLVSIATDTNVFVVILFDRAARVLFGCSADEFSEFAKTHPFAEEEAQRRKKKLSKRNDHFTPKLNANLTASSRKDHYWNNFKTQGFKLSKLKDGD